MAEPIHAPIRVLLFAGLREQAGWAVREWCPGPSLDGAPTAHELWERLELPGQVGEVRVAINQQFASADTLLHPGDELAFLPPISGG